MALVLRDMLLSQHDIHLSFGSALVATLLSTFLFGVSTVQWYCYDAAYGHDDPRWIRVVVLVLWLLDLVQVTFSSVAAYHYLIGQFHQPSGLNFWHWSLAVTILSEPFSGLICQIYLVRGFWMLNRRKHQHTALVISLLSITGFVWGVYNGIGLFWVDTFAEASSQVLRVTMFHAFSTTADVFAPLALGWALWSTRTGFKNTDLVVKRLTIWTIQTGFLTSAAAIVNLILFVTIPNAPLSASVRFVVAKLYSNTVIASLNRRHLFQGNKSDLHIDFGDETDGRVNLGVGGSDRFQLGEVGGGPDREAPPYSPIEFQERALVRKSTPIVNEDMRW